VQDCEVQDLALHAGSSSGMGYPPPPYLSKILNLKALFSKSSKQMG
jgi:hypothetical protein